ncbi:MAG: fibronectin type III domain-containing protein [Candidatus Nomurabacteria bacterium]|nr:fibronectin type III domain-containing protein [Candidatus Nomurabacteria bacterium]
MLALVISVPVLCWLLAATRARPANALDDVDLEYVLNSGGNALLIYDMNGDLAAGGVDYTQALANWPSGAAILQCAQIQQGQDSGAGFAFAYDGMICGIPSGTPAATIQVEVYMTRYQDWENVGSFDYDPSYLNSVDLTATAGDGSVKLTWTADADPTPTFVLKRSASSSTCATGATTLLSGSSLTSYSDSGLSNGTTYYYCITASNTAGSASDYASAKPKASVVAPSAPTLTAATPTSTSVDLTWAAPSSTGGAALTGYEIDWSTSNSFSTYSSSTVGGSTLTYAPANLAAGQVYYFRVRAENSAGWGAYSNVLSGQTIYVSISSQSASLSIDVNLKPGKISSEGEDLTLSTNDTLGLTLSVSADGDLTNGSYTIPAISGTFATPVALTAGVPGWGVRVDGQGNYGLCEPFGSNYDSLDCLFSAVGGEIYRSTTPLNSQEVDVEYGVSAGNNQAAGKYSANVTYTAVAN